MLLIQILCRDVNGIYEVITETPDIRIVIDFNDAQDNVQY